MGKIGYAPKWTAGHAKVLEEYLRRKNDTSFVSKTFKDVDDALEWLHGK